MKFPAALIVSVIFVSAAMAAESHLQRLIEAHGGMPWQPPSNGIVTSGRTAISIAHAIAADDPAMAAHVADERKWQSTMKATLENGVWEVFDEVPRGSIGGSCSFFISQADAHFLGAYCTQ